MLGRSGWEDIEEETPTPSSVRALVIEASSTPTTPARRREPWIWVIAFTVFGLSGVLLGIFAARGRNSFESLAAAMPIPKKVVAPIDQGTLTSCPDEMALVSDGKKNVCVDRWEGSIVEEKNGVETAWSPYTPVDGKKHVKAVSRPGVVPQGYISRNQAEEACGAAGKRLCTADEWTSACRGPDSTQYPYGEEENTKACNSQGKSPMSRVYGARWAKVGGSMNLPMLNQLPDTVAKTGAYEACTNEYGVYDMVGNLHEWTSEKTGAFRGGYYLDTKVNGAGCGYVTTAHWAGYHDYSTGFRCCKDAD